MSDSWGDVGNVLQVPKPLNGLCSPAPGLDALVTRQLMRVEDVLRLPSARAVRRGQTAAAVMMTRDISAPYFQRIMERMERDGINKFPVCVAPADALDCWDHDPELARSGRLAFGGGHHRLRMAVELGWTRIMTTDSLTDHEMGITELRLLHRSLGLESEKGPQ